MDHVTPLTKRGGNRSKENISLACKECNRKKGPLELEMLGDLSPEALSMKFEKVVKTTRERKGHFREWIGTLDEQRVR